MGVLKNQNAFITGGGSGIGLACAKPLQQMVPTF